MVRNTHKDINKSQRAFKLLSRDEQIAEIERKILLLPLEKKKLVLQEIDAILSGQ